MAVGEGRRFVFKVFTCPDCGEHAARDETKFGDPSYRFHCDACGLTWTDATQPQQDSDPGLCQNP